MPAALSVCCEGAEDPDGPSVRKLSEATPGCSEPTDCPLSMLLVLLCHSSCTRMERSASPCNQNAARSKKSAASASARSGRRSPVSAKEVIEINSTGGSSQKAALVLFQTAIPPRRSVDLGDDLVHRAQQVPNSDSRKSTRSRLSSPTPRSASSICCDAVGTSWLSKWSLQTLRNWPGLLVRRRPQLRLDRRGGPLTNTSGPPPG